MFSPNLLFKYLISFKEKPYWRKTNTIKSYNIGDVININNINYFVCGIVINPLILIEAEEPSYKNNGY